MFYRELFFNFSLQRREDSCDTTLSDPFKNSENKSFAIDIDQENQYVANDVLEVNYEARSVVNTEEIDTYSRELRNSMLE